MRALPGTSGKKNSAEGETGVGTVAVLLSLELGEAGFLDVSVPKGRPATLYARSGDLPVAVFLLVTLGALTVAARRNGIAKAS